MFKAKRHCVKLGDGTKVDMSWKGQPYDLAPLLKGRNTVVRIENLQLDNQ